MAEITLTNDTINGFSVATQSASSGGDYIVNNGNTLLYVANGSGSSINVTIDSPNQCSQGFTHDNVVAVGAGVSKWIGVFDQKRFNDVNGRVQITYSDVTSVTVGGIKI